MHLLMRHLLKALQQQALIPQRVLLTGVSLVTRPTNAALPDKTHVKCRTQGNFYVFNGGWPGEYGTTHYTLTFWQPSNPKPTSFSFTPTQGRHMFSQVQLDRFLLESADANPLHQGPMPIVPGLLIVEWVLSQLRASGIDLIPNLRVEFRFKSPLLCQQAFEWQASPEGYNLAAGDHIFTEILVMSESEFQSQSQSQSQE